MHAAADGLTLKPCPSDFVPTVGNEINKLVSNVAMALKFSAAGLGGVEGDACVLQGR